LIKEIIVVEGKDDTVAVQRAVKAETIETGGSAINNEIFRQIALAQERRGVIILTDPDHAGERLRRLITERVPGCKHAFISREEADYKGDIGVENASPETIRRALEQVKSEMTGQAPQIEVKDLLEAGLLSGPDSSQRRMALGKLLGIGYANGKQFYKRCTMFQITREEFLRAVEQLKQEGDSRR
jgi:ribonuclease M5